MTTAPQPPLRHLMYAILSTRWKKPVLYQGMWYLKRDAIETHCREKNKTWKQALADGDTCVRIMVEVSR